MVFYSPGRLSLFDFTAHSLLYITFLIVAVRIVSKSVACDDPKPQRQPGKNCDDAPNSITVGGVEHSPKKRGLNIVVVSRELGHVIATDTFNFSRKTDESKRFSEFVGAMPRNAVVIGSVKGDIGANFGEKAKETLVGFFAFCSLLL